MSLVLVVVMPLLVVPDAARDASMVCACHTNISHNGIDLWIKQMHKSAMPQLKPRVLGSVDVF